MTILIATTNPGKIREIRLVLAGMHHKFVGLADLAPVAEPEETGATFAANAELKARYYAAATGLPTVAEDSGLVVDAIGGRPGVESARYPGDTYPEKFVNLYAELAPHTRPWTARFVCSLAYVEPQPASGTPVSDPDLETRFVTEATVEGQVAKAPWGAHGFGYDPIFYYPPYSTTLGDVPDLKKLAIAHRGKAFRAFRQWLDNHGPARVSSRRS